MTIIAVYEDAKVEISIGAIVGITISAIIVVELICFSIVWFGIKKKKFSDLFHKKN